jgi:hypothetical protein
MNNQKSSIINHKSAILVLLLCGCGRSGPALVPVEGTITRNGGEWPARGTLAFEPLEVAEGAPRLYGMAEFAADGQFAVTSFRPGDGLAPGRYKVTVESWAEWPTETSPGKGNYVPTAYREAATTPLEVIVPAGQRRVKVEWDVAGGDL